ncbi:MAG: fibronectin-binding protein [Peptococcaceae bacterium BRH_c4b]|nr:MAG: fibronectin-binding protein [Peptococcaceae bacterium BRH_c4b]
MPYDGLVLAAVKNELTQLLTGGRIEKIYQPAREEIHMIIHRQQQGRLRLLLNASAGLARVHLTSGTRENPAAAPLFCMVLRKHLEGGRINSIDQQGLERILVITVDARDELGRPSSKKLVCEIMGRHSNIILLDSENTILDGIRRYTHAVSRHREVLPGRPYIAPPPQNKLNPLELDEEEFFRVLLSRPLNKNITDIIQKDFEGLSPLMAGEIVYRSGLSLNTPLELCGEYELRTVWLNLRKIMKDTGAGQFRPTLVLDPKKLPLEFAAFELTRFTGFETLPGGMNSLVDHYYCRKQEEEILEREKQSLLATVRKEMSRLGKKLALQLESIDEAGEREQFRIAGDLITANIYRINKGDREAVLEDFYQPECPAVAIALDPRLSPSENAQQYFKKYNKAKSTLAAARYQAGLSASELHYFSGVENAIIMAETTGETAQIRQELASQDYLKLPPPPRGKKSKERDIPHPLVFVSSSGITILVGKNNRQNDHLTMKMARDDDIWLHTKDIPGSHVIIRASGQEPEETTLTEAASLAAYFSKARESGRVPVDYTLRKYVSKPGGAKPGYVIYTNQKTLFVDPRQDLAESLRQSGSEN